MSTSETKCSLNECRLAWGIGCSEAPGSESGSVTSPRSPFLEGGEHVTFVVTADTPSMKPRTHPVRFGKHLYQMVKRIQMQLIIQSDSSPSLADDMNFPKAQFVLTLISLDPLGFKVSVSETVTFRKRLELSPGLNVKCFSSSPEGHSGSSRGQVPRGLGSAPERLLGVQGSRTCCTVRSQPCSEACSRLHPWRAGVCWVVPGARGSLGLALLTLELGAGEQGVSCSECANGRAVLVQTLPLNRFTLVSAV